MSDESLSWPEGDTSEPESGPIWKLAASIDGLSRAITGVGQVLGVAEYDAGADMVRMPFADAMRELASAFREYVQLERDKMGPS